MDSVDSQQFELLNQIQNNLLGNDQFFSLYLVLSLPLPVSWRLTLYNFLISLPKPFSSPLWLTLIIVLSPLLILLLLFILYKLILKLIRNIPKILSLFGAKPETKKTLQLIFPADTSKSAYATEELFSLLHSLSRQLTFKDRLFQRKNEYSLEIVSSKIDGIRYLLSADSKFIQIIKHHLLSYLPGIKIKEVNNYFTVKKIAKTKVKLIELKQANHFALPLEDQKTLSENDPITYLTGAMTNLAAKNLICYQIVVTPIINQFHSKVVRELSEFKNRLYQKLPLTEKLFKTGFQKLEDVPILSIFYFLIKAVCKIISTVVIFVFSMIIGFFDTSGKLVPFLQRKDISPQEILNPYEKQLAVVVKNKIDSSLFETSIKILIIAQNNKDINTRVSGLLASFGQLSSSHQSLIRKKYLFKNLKNSLKQFGQKSLSKDTTLNPNPILSISELSDLYHFPYGKKTKSEGLVTSHSPELPSPLSVKNNPSLDVVFGKNRYGENESNIGLTDDDRSRHVYTIGQTGLGKITIIFHMAKDDIQKGRGVAVIDPHGDLAQDLLYTVPKNRFDDCIYLNPFDLKYPIGINLIELKVSDDEDELEQEKELVCESVISIFRRLFSSKESSDSHRIEYILRNTIYTAFTVKDSTIFTVYDLLNDPNFRKTIISNLENKNLVNFWKNEFGKAGNYQAVKMVSGVTAKIGRFLFSPTAKRMLEQPKSTINFDEIIDKGKILICNLAEGKLGEDTSQLLGTTIIAKLQQSFMRRVRTRASKRIPFYLFVDEFQNFATSSFSKLLSGGRKFGLRLTIAQQSTAQQNDRNIVNIILANTGTIVCFRTASPIDEQLMLDQFSPYVKKGDIGNLPRFNFYLKLSAIKPEEPFSGETIPIVLDRDENRFNQLIKTSRKNWARAYQKEVNKVTKSEKKTEVKEVKKPFQEVSNKRKISV